MASVFKRGGRKNRGGFYLMAWKDSKGRWKRRCSGTTDKEAALEIARELEKEAARRRAGLVDEVAERIALEGRRPLEEHLRAYEAKLRAAGRSARHVGDTMRLIREVMTFTRWDSIGKINADGSVRFAEHLRGLNRSARTIQSYLIALKSFTRWLHREGKLPADPLAGLKRPNPATDRRHERRALLADEWPWLEAAARGGPDRYGMTGPERATLYRLAIETGLRSAELRSLTRSSLRLDDDAPCVVVAGRATKNKKDARQFIGADLVEALR
ncbi:MAG TPA: site-specific integrase, partial [Pirellulaceae bacterium]|nr:site-specific integrase [Pirellulaceae bacterium]